MAHPVEAPSCAYRQQVWGVEPNEPEALLSELRSIADDVAGAQLDLSQPASPADYHSCP